MTDDNFWVGHLHAYRHDATSGNVMLDSMIDEPGPHHRWSVCVLLDRAEQIDLAAAFLLTLIFSTPDTKETDGHE